jgi:hypothetical protein
MQRGPIPPLKSARRKLNCALATLLASAIAAPAASPARAEADVPQPSARLVSAPAAPRESHPPTVAYVVVGLAGAAAVVGTIFGVKALRDKNSFDGGDRTTERVESIEKNALLADMAFGASLTLGVTAVVLWLSRPEGPSGLATRIPHGRTVDVSPMVLSSIPGAAAIFHF